MASCEFNPERIWEQQVENLINLGYPTLKYPIYIGQGTADEYRERFKKETLNPFINLFEGFVPLVVDGRLSPHDQLIGAGIANFLDFTKSDGDMEESPNVQKTPRAPYITMAKLIPYDQCEHPLDTSLRLGNIFDAIALAIHYPGQITKDPILLQATVDENRKPLVMRRAVGQVEVRRLEKQFLNPNTKVLVCKSLAAI